MAREHFYFNQEYLSMILAQCQRCNTADLRDLIKASCLMPI